MSAPAIAMCEPGVLARVGDRTPGVDWASVSPMCLLPEYEGLMCNTGPLCFLTAADHILKAEGHKPDISQLCAFQYPEPFAWRWFYLSRRVANVLAALAERPRSSRWMMAEQGADARSQVAVGRYIGITIVTIPLTEPDEDGKAPCVWEILRPIRFGSSVFEVSPKPLAEVLPPPDQMLNFRTARIHEVSSRRLSAAVVTAGVLASRTPAKEPLHQP